VLHETKTELLLLLDATLFLSSPTFVTFVVYALCGVYDETADTCEVVIVVIISAFLIVISFYGVPDA